jgi:hypothetical protein
MKKTLKNVTDVFSKYGKIIIVLFTIKILLFGSLFLFNSCKKQIPNLVENQQQESVSNMKDVTIESLDFIKNDLNIQELKKEKSLTFSDEIEVKAKKELTPIIENGLNVLYSYGLTDKDILENFESLEDPKIALLALAIVSVESTEETHANLNSFLVNNSFAAQPSIGSCAMDALGIPASLLMGTAKGTSAKAIMKAAGKLAGRTIGYIGLAIAIYDFADCMNYINY